MIDTYWKPITFLLGLGILICGALTDDYSDWDIPVSILMACSTYLSADRFVEAALKLDIKRLFILLPLAWWAIDGSYWVYWGHVDKTVMIREGQWLASACLYLLAGFVWQVFRPATFVQDLQQALRTLKELA